MRMLALFLLLAAGLWAKTILIVAADAPDFVLAAGGAVAAMIEAGDRAILVRVTNEDKDSYGLTAEETALRSRAECEQAAGILGIGKVVHLGYRAGELGGVSPTEIRDRILFQVRLHKPDVMFIPNPYAEYVEQLDRHYVGMAAEEARRAAALGNHQPPHEAVGLKTHHTPELYYYAQPVDPRRREPESTATFVPQPVVKDIARTFAKKVRAAQALKTSNHAMAMRVRERLEATGRRLPLLDTVDDASVAKLAELNVAGLAKIGAADSPYRMAEEFHYAGKDFQVPEKLRAK